MTWRERARKAIDAALREADRLGLDDAEREKCVRSHYPFGPRENHPYKVWCDEVNRTLHPRPEAPEGPGPLPGQGWLFDEKVEGGAA